MGTDTRNMRTSIAVGLAAIASYLLFCRPQFSASDLKPSLKGRVAVVTGGSRGIGKGIAIGLGETNATIYITGRTLASGAKNTGGVNGASQKGSLEETCEQVLAAGARGCIPVAVDSADDEALLGLFNRVMEEQGRLDVLVNNAFSAVSHLPKTQGMAFWEKGVETFDIVNQVGLRSHYVSSVYAAQRMQSGGLIINLSSFGGLNYIFDVAYGLGKAAMDRMANDMAVELATENIAMVSLWPGLVRTENVNDGALDEVAMAERRGRQPGQPPMNAAELLPTPLCETPLFTGRAVAHLARDNAKMDHTGRVVVSAVMARDYGFTDERGVRSPPLTSIKSMASSLLLKPLLKSAGIWEISDHGELNRLNLWSQLYWNWLPDGMFPGKLLKVGAGAPNL